MLLNFFYVFFKRFSFFFITEYFLTASSCMEKKMHLFVGFYKKKQPKNKPRSIVSASQSLSQTTNKILCHVNHFRQIKSVGICCAFPLG